MIEEAYPDQFTPWVPNHIIGDEYGEVYDADNVYGGAYSQYLADRHEAADLTMMMLTGALVTNFYIDHFAFKSTEK